MTGFWNKHLGGWVGPRPRTRDEESAIEAANLAYVAAEQAAREAAQRPDRERIDELCQTILTVVDPDLVAAVAHTGRQVTAANDRIRQTKTDLAAHLAREADLTPDDVEPWAARLFTLERSIPVFEGQARAAAAAVAEARTALADAASKAGAFYVRAAADAILEAESAARTAIETARHDLALVNAGISRARDYRG